MPVALWKRFGFTHSNDLKLILNHMYWQKQMSQSGIAKELGCDVSCIERWFRKLEISTRSQSKALGLAKQRTFKIPEEQREALDGLMLSDLHIESQPFQARASFGFKHLEFAEAVIKITSSLQWGTPKYNKQSSGWYAKTKYCTNLKYERERWYKNRKKIVPADIKITPTILLWWYLGDGYITKYGAVLCTDSFSKEDNYNLVNLINLAKIPCHLTPRNRIRIEGHKGLQAFLAYIGKSPVKCYEYKWGDMIRR